MSEFASPIILAGPTAVGKTDIANELADRTDGHLITADKFYLYAGEFFMTGLGLEPGELEDGRSRHLYGCLEPTDPILPTEDYLAQAVDAIDAVHADGHVAIVEGCSYKYTTALIGYYGLGHAVDITWTDRSTLPQTVTRRIDSLVGMGLYEETEHALKAGYANTYPMSSILYRPAIQVVRGAITHEEAVASMTVPWLQDAHKNDDLYAATVGLRRLVHDRSQVGPTVRAIENIFEKLPK